MEGVSEVDGFLFTIVLLSLGFIALVLVADVIERSYEREQRRRRPRPRIPDNERRLLGDDWTAVARRKTR